MTFTAILILSGTLMWQTYILKCAISGLSFICLLQTISVVKCQIVQSHIHIAFFTQAGIYRLKNYGGQLFHLQKELSRQ